MPLIGEIISNEVFDWVRTQLRGPVTIDKESYGDQSCVFRIKTPTEAFYLKMGEKLARERDRLQWAAGKLPLPRVIALRTFHGNDAMLLTAIEGRNLAALCKAWAPEKIVRKLVECLRVVHSVDASGCPFGTPGPGHVLVHGDACLPNFIFRGEELAGFIDLGDARIASRDVDLAASVWSLQYNLGPGYGRPFLQQYGLTNVSDELVETLRRMYETMQQVAGQSFYQRILRMASATTLPSFS